MKYLPYKLEHGCQSASLPTSLSRHAKGHRSFPRQDVPFLPARVGSVFNGSATRGDAKCKSWLTL